MCAPLQLHIVYRKVCGESQFVIEVDTIECNENILSDILTWNYGNKTIFQNQRLISF